METVDWKAAFKEAILRLSPDTKFVVIPVRIKPPGKFRDVTVGVGEKHFYFSCLGMSKKIFLDGRFQPRKSNFFPRYVSDSETGHRVPVTPINCKTTYRQLDAYLSGPGNFYLLLSKGNFKLFSDRGNSGTIEPIEIYPDYIYRNRLISGTRGRYAGKYVFKGKPITTCIPLDEGFEEFPLRIMNSTRVLAVLFYLNKYYFLLINKNSNKLFVAHN